jgi:glycosyltransferase involved in cell wall biosynthesis
MPPLTAIIITFNEEKKIATCLSSVKDVADDIVVVDSFSTDKTKEICLSYNVRFFEHIFEGYIEQKNWAIKQAKYNYVLSLDADESLSEQLKETIISIKNNWKYDGYSMNRLTNYCGKWIRHGGWYPDKKLRLIDSTKGQWGGTNPHDRFVMHRRDGQLGHLKGDLLHYSYDSVEDHLKQTENFTTIAAQALFERGYKLTFVKRYLSFISKFIVDYFFKFGFLDGYYGFIIAFFSAKATYTKYNKLKRLYRN